MNTFVSFEMSLLCQSLLQEFRTRMAVADWREYDKLVFFQRSVAVVLTLQFLSGIAKLTFGIFFMVALKVRSGSTVSHVDHGSMTLSQVKRSHLGRRQLESGVVFLRQQSTYNVIYVYN